MLCKDRECSNQQKNIGTDARSHSEHETIISKCNDHRKFREKWCGLPFRAGWTSIWIPATHSLPTVLCESLKLNSLIITTNELPESIPHKFLFKQEMFPLSKHEFTAHLKRKHYEPNSTGSNSFSSDYFPEAESTAIIDYNKTSPNVNFATHFE